MNCESCGGLIRVEHGEHKYPVGGINVVLSNVILERCTKCGELEVVIPAVEKLHGAIARAILSQRAPLDGGMVRFMRLLALSERP